MRAQKKQDSKKGQTSVEYILIVGLLVGVVVMFGGQFRDRITDVVGTLFGGVNDSISRSMNPNQ